MTIGRWTTICLAVLCLSVLALAQENKTKSGPVTGTWDCTAHGGEDGDTPFSLELVQNGESVTGSVSSSQGGMEITSATFKNDMLEIHLDTENGNYVLTGKLKDGKFNGQTTLDGKEHGTWEGKKAAEQGKSGS